jgi:hypothetical protein
MDEADDGVSDPVPFDAAFDSMVDLQWLDIDGMLTAFGCHPMQSSMDNWSSLEEDESLFDNNGFSGVFSDVRISSAKVLPKSNFPKFKNTNNWFHDTFVHRFHV